MAIEIVDFPIKNGGSFHSYVSSPEGTIVSLGKCVFFVHLCSAKVRNMDPSSSEQLPPLYISRLGSIFWHKHSQKIEMLVSAHE